MEAAAWWFTWNCRAAVLCPRAVKTIRWGILGAGSISEDFCAGLKLARGCEAVAVASRSSTRAEAFARKHKVEAAPGIEALAERADLDVVYIATPPAQHKAHALACLTRGKSVLLEKPFAVTAAEAKEIVACARERKLFCMEAMWMRFMPVVRELFAALHTGRYGAVLSVEASLGFAQGTSERGPALLDLGVYPLSFVQALLGKPQRVVAAGDDAELSAVLQYARGTASVRASSRAQLRNDAVIYAEQAVLHVEAPLYRSESFTVQAVAPQPSGGGAKAGKLRALTQRPELRRWVQRARRAALPRVTKPALGNGFAHEAIEVADCLRNGAKESALMPLDASVAVMETVDAVRAACV
jgi:predicted dehydrogenase